jgi:hypothetical protein
MQIKKSVMVTIESDELLKLLIQAMLPKVEMSQGKESVLYRAFSNLAGNSSVEAVRRSNRYAKDNGLPTITTDEFRRWLPEMLSEIFFGFLYGHLTG